MATFPQRRTTGRRLIALAMLVLIAAGLLAFPPVRISYHRWQLERGRDYMLGLDECWGTGEFLWTDSFDGYSGDATHFDHHLHRLRQSTRATAPGRRAGLPQSLRNLIRLPIEGETCNNN